MGRQWYWAWVEVLAPGKGIFLPALRKSSIASAISCEFLDRPSAGQAIGLDDQRLMRGSLAAWPGSHRPRCAARHLDGSHRPLQQAHPGLRTVPLLDELAVGAIHQRHVSGRGSGSIWGITATTTGKAG